MTKPISHPIVDTDYMKENQVGKMRNIRSNYSLFGFLISFPMVLISFISSEKIPQLDYFNSYFAFSIFITVLFGGFLFVFDIRKALPRPLPTTLALFTLIIAILIVSLHSYLNIHRVAGLSLLNTALSGSAQILGAFFIIYYWDFESPLHKYTAIGGAFICAILVLLYTQEGTIVDGFAPPPVDDSGATSVAYQMIGRVVTVSGLLAMASTRKLIPLASILIISVAALYINGARTEFLLFLLSASVMILLIEIKKGATFYVTLALSTVATILIATNAQQIISMLPQSRILEVIKIEQSTSWNARAIAYEYAIYTIEDSPVLGDYGSDFDRFGPGYYAHNIASSWVELGLLGFLIMLFMLVRPLLFSLRWAFQKGHLPTVRLCTGTAIYCLLGYFFSYYYLTAYIGFSVGAFVRAWNDAKPVPLIGQTVTP